ncbi:MAG TPA: hypothetical protein VL096_04580 [Pirellulaceae bacterium]|nr:hypothetical protein [Pirellulaceae bacterium]
MLTATFVWPEWFAAPWPTLGWLALSAFWLVACWRSLRQLPTLVDNPPDKTTEALFAQAQTEYLKGHWYDAEKLLGQLIAKRPRDVEAHLLLATLYRHDRRLALATQTLDRLEQLDGAGRWYLEIATERQKLKRLAEEPGSSGAANELSPTADDPHVGASQAA